MIDDDIEEVPDEKEMTPVDTARRQKEDLHDYRTPDLPRGDRDPRREGSTARRRATRSTAMIDDDFEEVEDKEDSEETGDHAIAVRRDDEKMQRAPRVDVVAVRRVRRPSVLEKPQADDLCGEGGANASKAWSRRTGPDVDSSPAVIVDSDTYDNNSPDLLRAHSLQLLPRPKFPRHER
ncbi:hypothetical protein CBR_g56898 [Chara braunii]|uniref:Uncharacterized protein n=1 Tax=Chara braunii TaxID=69332 RepID=A0A388MDU5_CHABU|nr:hypothetical protein CBR_g56898 [Chara braunii]|eukprot:GBG92736.1 hypothetical protein CBR_g56898 [Chara braunii]